MLPDVIGGILWEALKMLNWQLANLPKEQAEAAAARFDKVVAFIFDHQWKTKD